LLFLTCIAPNCLFGQQTDIPTYRSETTEVLVPTLVTDQEGSVIFGLTAKDFVIKDNGVEQTVLMDETFSTKPVSLVIAVQTGGTASSAIGSGCALLRDVNEFTRPPRKCRSPLHGIGLMLETFLNVPGSEMALVSFDSQVKLRREFSPDVSNVTKSLDTLPGGDGGSALLDAVQFSLSLLKNHGDDHRRVMVVISQQSDDASKAVTLEKAARQIIASDIEVYMVAYPPDFKQAAESFARLFGPARSSLSSIPGSTGVPGSTQGSAASLDILGLISLLRSSAAHEENIPQTIANLTGGEYVLFHNEKGLDEALGLLANHAHNRYQLSFKVRNPAPGPHKLEVFVREGGGVRISARAGYLPTPTQTLPSMNSE
jgi:VWFA-related protein